VKPFLTNQSVVLTNRVVSLNGKVKKGKLATKELAGGVAIGGGNKGGGPGGPEGTTGG
jgi:hypothetical protein